MGKLMSKKVVVSLIGAALLGVSSLATSGGAFASGPDDYDYWNHSDGHGQYYGHPSVRWHDGHFDDNRDFWRYRFYRNYTDNTTVETSTDYYFAHTYGALATLVENTATVIGVDVQNVYNELKQGHSLLEIAIEHGVGQAALIEGLTGLDPSVSPFVAYAIGLENLLTSGVYLG